MDEGVLVLPGRVVNGHESGLFTDKGPCQLPAGVGIGNPDVLRCGVLGDALGAAFTSQS
jgi:hypothetical protein